MRVFQITPSTMKWCRFTTDAASTPRPMSNGTEPSSFGANTSEGSTHIAAPAASALPK